ncbi:putative tricarboxylic transport membrane protein [Desulfuromusa kysingii]|uniref:Putative tricarboxylic transport membrane protein n=1 Tax=Desulfuromusa kysingii TaxID=37625 RepID=A0A1H4AWP0_9BACT|nr:tripartite tricarboxylate transporter substrate-binding protein [Desulfuromusa kysingii]SEA40323.1 putative tricarboxylic transport membrane protein [Desulfuromusa kysingii]
MKRIVCKLIIFLALFALALPVGTSLASDEVDELHFLIPGGAGGGWDGTARGVGKVLLDSGLLKHTSFENMSGGGGGKALNHLIGTAKRQQNTMLVNSTPIIIRSLTGVFPQSFHDLTPIAAVIADYAALVVPKDSKYQTLDQVLADFKADPRSIKIGGGSVKGGMDHLVPAMIIKAAGGNPLDLGYIPYDAGGKAMAGLLSGDIKVLATGFSEALGLANQGEVRIIAVTSEERLAQAPGVQTVKESGIDVTFANWRGFFGAPGLPEARAQAYRDLLKKMYDTPEWEDIRSKRGWQNLYKPGTEFTAFLDNQEKAIGDMMRELGFIK